MTTPKSALSDLKKYIDSHGVTLTSKATTIFKVAEEIGHEKNYYLYTWVFLYSCVHSIRDLRSIMARHGSDPATATRILKERIDDGDSIFSPYNNPKSRPYSHKKYRNTARTSIIDLCISIARRNGRSEITELDVFEALLETHDQDVPIVENSTWTDEALHTPFNTLSHIHCSYEPSLWVRFDDLRKELNLATGSSPASPAELAPPEVRSALLSLLVDYPDVRQNAFLIMPFTKTPMHGKIASTLKSVMSDHGFNLLRADDHIYSDDVLHNVLAYAHASRFSVAVFERVFNDQYNPNVSLEVGYMMALRKPVCLLKERSLQTLQSDLVGKLYMQFDIHDIDASIQSAVSEWLRAKQLEP